MLYHYTDRLSAADIIRDGLIKAFPLTLHADMLARDKGVDTEPAVWLTASEIPEMTILAKMKVNGWPFPPVGDLFRFVLPADYAHAIPFPPETEIALGCEPVWWKWTRATAELAGSKWEDWRTVGRDILSSDWVRVEFVKYWGKIGPTWATK